MEYLRIFYEHRYPTVSQIQWNLRYIRVFIPQVKKKKRLKQDYKKIKEHNNQEGSNRHWVQEWHLKNVTVPLFTSLPPTFRNLHGAQGVMGKQTGTHSKNRFSPYCGHFCPLTSYNPMENGLTGANWTVAWSAIPMSHRNNDPGKTRVYHCREWVSPRYSTWDRDPGHELSFTQVQHGLTSVWKRGRRLLLAAWLADWPLFLSCV